MPTRPDVEVLVPKTWFVGEPAELTVKVTAKEPTKIDGIDVGVFGEQGWAVGSGKSRVTEQGEFPSLLARVMEAGTLEPGTTTFRPTLTLPHGTAPSHDLSPAWAHLEIRVRVWIPWWPDRKVEYIAPVRLPPRTLDGARTPIAVRSTPRDAPTDAPRLELSLASTRIVAGEPIVGSLAVFHMDDRDGREITVRFEPHFELYNAWRTRERAGDGYEVTIRIPPGGAGTTVPFRFSIPETVTPSFQTVTHKLDWRLVATTGSFFSRKAQVTVPIEIFDASAAAVSKPLTETPGLSDDRALAAFDRFASEAGWRMVPAERRNELALAHEHGEAELRIDYDYRGTKGAFLVGRIDYPKLGLNLSVTPSTTIRELVSSDLEIDLPAWDRAHHVTARFDDQARPLLAKLVPALFSAMDSGRLVRWDDDDLVFERSVAGVEQTDLRRLASALTRCADAIAAARTTIAPPPEVEIDVAAWQELARALDGSLTVGDLSISGRLGTHRVELGLVWPEDDAPRLRAHVGDATTASALAREVTLALARPTAAGVPERLAEHVAKLPNDLVDLRIERGVASASRALTRIDDHRRARELIDALRSLVTALDQSIGPYR